MANLSKKAPKAGHLCHRCHEPIEVEAMIILVLSGMWSVQDGTRPQLQAHLKLHPDCTYDVIAQWERDYGRPGTVV